jgi:hypothetical protein
MAALSVDIPIQRAIDAELEYFASLAQQSEYIYYPLIINTGLTMMVLHKLTGNLLLSSTIPYGGYQLKYNGTDHIEESLDDITVNDAVNSEILAHINSGKTHFAVSLFLHNPDNAADNHANMLLFEYGAKSKINSKKILTVFHYEPYGQKWFEIFPRIADEENKLIHNIIKRIKKTIPVKVNHQLTTRIDQSIISLIQGLTESGYCQIISLLQAYLFLKYGNKVDFTPDGKTPLGSGIGATSPSASGGRLQEFQLNVIRGFIIHIGQLINQIFEPIGIDVSISTISHIQHIYNEENDRLLTLDRDPVPPIYLIYIDALVKYIAEQIRNGSIRQDNLIKDIRGISQSSKTVKTYTELTSLENSAMRLLRRLINGDFGLLDNEQRRIITAYNAAADRVAADRVAADRVAAARAARAADNAEFGVDPNRIFSNIRASKTKNNRKVKGPVEYKKTEGGKTKGKTKKKRRKTKKRRERQRK